MALSKKKNKRSSIKTKKVDLAPKNEVKEMFMSWFKRNNNIGQVMTKEDVVRNIIAKLDSKQNDALEEAMNELNSYGIIEVKDDGVTLILTEKGSKTIL